MFNPFNEVSYENRSFPPLVFFSFVNLCMIRNDFGAFPNRSMENYHWGLPFQQDGAPARRAKFKFDYLFDIDAPVLAWAPCSPNMNVIENCWGDVNLIRSMIYIKH